MNINAETTLNFLISHISQTGSILEKKVRSPLFVLEHRCLFTFKSLHKHTEEYKEIHPPKNSVKKGKLLLNGEDQIKFSEKFIIKKQLI